MPGDLEPRLGQLDHHSITQMHDTAAAGAMGPLCLGHPIPTGSRLRGSRPPGPHLRQRPFAWRMWGPLLEPPTIAQHRGLRAARARYGNGFLAARPQQEFVRGAL
jgi:hypothetical protein